jgi:hypothetical protein
MGVASLASGFRERLLTAGVAHKKSAFELGGLGLSRVLSAPVREALSR